MSLDGLFAASTDVVCVAEDTVVSFLAPKTLKKFHVEKLNGSCVCGIFLQSSPRKGSMLHVVDADANYFQLRVGQGAPTLTHSAAILLQRDAKADVTATGVPRGATSSSTASTENQRPRRTAESSVVLSAQFYHHLDQLFCVLLTSDGVYEVLLSGHESSHSTSLLGKRLHTLGAEKGGNPLLSVGERSGLIICATTHEAVMFYSTISDRPDSGHSVRRGEQSKHQQKPTFHRREVPLHIQSIACSPVSDGVAVGGDRGELAVYLDIRDEHCFSDHWHHTPLTAIAFSVDGAAVYTGAREEVLQVWDLAQFQHKKISCQLGPLRSVRPFADRGSSLLVSCNESTLAVVDLLQMGVVASVEGVEWSARAVCTGLVVGQWMAQPAVVLTGLPNVVRVCDPFTQQAIYSLHISSQMETLPNSPSHGIQFVGVLEEGRALITYETFGSSALPPLLRFWYFDVVKKKHMEAQTVYRPHVSSVLALEVDHKRGRVFTLSAEAVKCWTRTTVNVTSTFTGLASNWHNVSTCTTPTQQVQVMALSADGAMCFVADDCVHGYNVSSCKPGERWPLVVTLPQFVNTHLLQSLRVMPNGNVVVASSGSHLFLWALDRKGNDVTAVDSSTAPITAICVLTNHTVLAARSDCSLIEVDCNDDGGAFGAVRRCVANASRHPFQHIAPLHLNAQRLVAVDAASGLRVLHLSSASAGEAVTEEQGITAEVDDGATPQPSDTAAAMASNAQQSFQKYFREIAIKGNDGDDILSRGNWATAQQTAAAEKWLGGVLGEPAYTVPPMNTVLSMYLKHRQ